MRLAADRANDFYGKNVMLADIEQVADHVFKAIRDEKFYIITHLETKDRVRTRMEDILQERNPTYQPLF